MKKLALLTCLGILAIGTAVPIAITATASQVPTIVMAAEVSSEPEADVEVANPVVESVNGWEKFVKEYLSADKVAMYMSWLAYIGTIIGLVANINRLKKANNLTLKNVSEDVKDMLEKVVGQEVTAQTERFLPAIVKTQEKTNDILKIFSKILALAQENTPESRVAILKLIEELGTVGKEVTETAKEVIEEECKAIEEKKREIDEKLDDIIEGYDGTSI